MTNPSLKKPGRVRPSPIGRAILVSAVILAIVLPASEVYAGFFSELLKLFANIYIGDRRSQFIKETETASNAAPVLNSTHNPEKSSPNEPPDISFVQDSSVVSPANPMGTLQDQANPDQVFLYTVKPGDTASSIARSFKISVNTILWANQLKSASALKINDEIVILPVVGIKYVVKRGDTVESIAKKYNQDAAEIRTLNGLPVGGTLEAGKEIIIPGGELDAPLTPETSKRYAALPNIKGYFARPIDGGYRSQGLHGANAVDLASGTNCNVVDTPIRAAAKGYVLIARETGWNGGYGKFIVINHPNGTQTLYAHAKRLLVAPGEEVSQGQIIAMVGNTGNTRGLTGCHVHFGVVGAANPW
ncbi:MAG: LysM peptidoglycan-binding domain-containing protein [Candidatus Sungbacteria bacterium]|nr:LysM peptidoglycan-binding domain-containing protein [Candidatus Sungbacteria bacterium]